MTPARPERRAPNTSAPSPPWLMPATTIARAPRLLSRAIGASNSARQSKNGRSRLRRCDQHISGVSTRYPAPLIAAASREMVPSGESVLPCMSTTPVVCADTDLPTPATAARVSNVSSSRLILATREKGSGRGLSLNLLPRARGILTAPAWAISDCGTGVGADGRERRRAAHEQLAVTALESPISGLSFTVRSGWSDSQPI